MKVLNVRISFTVQEIDRQMTRTVMRIFSSSRVFLQYAQSRRKRRCTFDEQVSSPSSTFTTVWESIVWIVRRFYPVKKSRFFFCRYVVSTIFTVFQRRKLRVFLKAWQIKERGPRVEKFSSFFGRNSWRCRLLLFLFFILIANIVSVLWKYDLKTIRSILWQKRVG